MKYPFIITLCFPMAVWAQFGPQVFASAGSEHTTSTGFTVSFTVGEAITASVENQNNHASQGFHQGLLQKCQALASSHPAFITPDPAFDSCEIQIALKGSFYPQFSTGQWLDSAGLELGVNDTIFASLDLGENRFRWVLSEDQCPGYDTAMQRVFLGLKADAVDDYLFTYMELQPNLIETAMNDLMLETSFLSKIITDDPPSGIEWEDGPAIGNFWMKTGKFEGETTLKYTVANTGYCKKVDTATIILVVQKLFGMGFNDGITPNGDGLNETFKLCDTLDCSIDLKIFNRWGDLVFEAKNYQNDWAGTNNDGRPLPTGTYFYHAKINASERRGAVTVLR